MAVVTYELKDTIGVLTINNPPVNALSHAVRQGIVDALDTAAQDESKALIVRCSGRTFVAGADITEFGKPPKSPSLPDVLKKLDTHPKLTLAAIHGTALGGGFETVLSCNYRIALSGAKVGLPEVKLGLLPGAGGTQRVPRLAGLKASVELITSGAPIVASRAFDWCLVDRVEPQSNMETPDLAIAEAALVYCKELLETGAEQRQASNKVFSLSQDDYDYIESCRAALTKKTRGEHAPQRILDCIVAAGELDFDTGLKRERELFTECMIDPQSSALRHMFFAERATTKIASLANIGALGSIQTVGIIGAGTMGGGIAMCFAEAGIQVTLLDTNQAAVDRGLDAVRKNYERSVNRGRLTESAAERHLSLIQGSIEYQSVAGVDLVIEAVFENLAVKQEVFKTLDQVCKPSAILATNTSYQDIDAIASVTNRPDQVCGMHFFSPANVMKLLEVVRAEKTSNAVVATIMAVGKSIGKISVLSGMCYGFIGNRMLRAYVREAGLCLIEGASPSQIDSAMEQWGMAMGPMAVGDLAGLDIGYKARQQLSPEALGDPAAYRVADRLVELGRLGQKTGAGYYLYDEQSRARRDDPFVMTLINEVSSELGINRRELEELEIVDRLTLALANEGAKIVEEGIAQRASDVDVVYCYGYGFPKYRGGPMHAMQARGIKNSIDRIEQFRRDLSEQNWIPADLLVRLASTGGTLD